MNLLGIDLGGTKTAVCAGNKKGDIAAARRQPTQPADGPAPWLARTLRQIGDVLREAGLDRSRIDAVGCACPGPMSIQKGMLLAAPNMYGWRDVPLRKMLADALDKPVFLNNDANACAQAEFLWGSSAGARNLVYLTMSTGIGAGVIANGQIMQGAADLAGEVGHHVQDIHGPPCPCGQRGCWEMYCGGMNVANRLRERIAKEGIRTAILDEAGGDPAKIDFKAFRSAVRKGDTFALTCWDEYLERLAQGFGTVIQFFNPEVIVLGTIGIHAADLILPEMHRRLPRYAWSWGRAACRIQPSALDTKIGDLSALAVAVCAMK
jgi:glucokinase